jgi:hypothetical protein
LWTICVGEGVTFAVLLTELTASDGGVHRGKEAIVGQLAVRDVDRFQEDALGAVRAAARSGNAGGCRGRAGVAAASAVVAVRQQVGHASPRTGAGPKITRLSSQTSLTQSATVVTVSVEVDADTRLGVRAAPLAVAFCCSVLAGGLSFTTDAVSARGAGTPP